MRNEGIAIEESASDPARSRRKRVASRRPRRVPRRPWPRDVARWMFHGHLWLGVVGSMALLVICATGILLNHKRALGLMPDVENSGARLLPEALPLHQLAALAGAVVARGGEPPAVDRMDVRPGDGLVKVRFDDRVVTEVTLDLATGAVLHVGERNDVFLGKLHSGEIFGARGVLVSDAAAVLLTFLLISGYWLWLYPRRRI